MNRPDVPCNYAMLRFMPYPQTGEFVNVGVLINCLRPCLLRFVMEEELPARAMAMFPAQDAEMFRAVAASVRAEMERLDGADCDPGECQLAFREAVRPRESILRFGEVKTILTESPETVANELFRRYVRMEMAGVPSGGSL